MGKLLGFRNVQEKLENTCPMYSFSMCPNSTAYIGICIAEGQVWRDPIGFFEAGAASAYGIVELGVDSSF